jgi:hypothetical protein
LTVADTLALCSIVIYHIWLVSACSYFVGPHRLVGVHVLVLLSQSRVSVRTDAQTSRHCMGTSSLSTSCARPMAERAKTRASFWKCIVVVGR